MIDILIVYFIIDCCCSGSEKYSQNSSIFIQHGATDNGKYWGYWNILEKKYFFMPVLENTGVLPFSHISIVSPTMVNCIKMSFRHTGKYVTKGEVCPKREVSGKSP